MNLASISGFVNGAPEIRTTKDGRRILNFEIAVEGPGKQPLVPVAFFLDEKESVNVEPGNRVLVMGVIRHHRVRGLFVGANEIIPIAENFVGR